MAYQNIGFIGGGNMARSILGGLVADGYPGDHLHASEPDPDKRAALARDFGLHGHDNNAELARQCDALVLAVKPQIMHQVCAELAPVLAETPRLLISIAAGVRVDDLGRWAGESLPIIRVMPNTPALVQTGASALYANRHCRASHKDLAETLMRAVGLTTWLEHESLMDAVTALSGSGPAYVFLLMESMIKAGTELGLPEQSARLLTLQTALGAAKMALESDEDPATLRQRVTSPGGTTERAIQTFQDGGFEALVQKALNAASDRSRELGDMLGEK